MEQITTYVKLKATATAVLLMAVASAVLLKVTPSYVSLTVDVVIRPPWDGYAYDYFSQDYTLVVTP